MSAASEGHTSTIVLHAINGVGTGHLSRQVALARTVMAYQPGIWPVLLSEGPATLDIASDLSVLQIPSTAHLRDRLDHDEAAAERLLRAAVGMCYAALASLQPQVVVHDTLVWPPLQRAASLLGARQALCLRPRRDMEGYLNDELCPVRHMDLVFVPDVRSKNQAMGDVLESAGIDALWTGPIFRSSIVDRVETYAGFGIKPSNRLVVITAGGGSGQDALDHFDGCLAALRRVPVDNLSVVMVLGPLLKGLVRLDQGFPHELVLLRATDGLPGLLGSADLVMCRGGYGVVNESAAGGAQVLAAPATRNTDDQEYRVRQMEAVGRFGLIVEGVSSASLAHQIAAALDKGRVAPTQTADVTALKTLGARLDALTRTRFDPNALADLSDIHV